MSKPTTTTAPINETAAHPIGQQVGYIRVSTVGQNLDRQLAGVALDRIFSEKVSAKTIDRPELIAALDYLRTGDTLHIHSLDRVCRSGAGDAVKLVEELTSRGVGVKFHKEGLEFYGDMSAAQRGVLSILASVAEMERGMIKERQMEGIAAAKAKGKPFGRPRASAGDDSIMALLDEGLKMPQIVTRLGISRASAYRLLKAEQEQAAANTGTK
ncbi:MAG: recombinase family protein [Aliivibrio sp.]|nr:recombinase family protein [Aliivibrio sp.]